MDALVETKDLVCGYEGRAITAPLNLAVPAGRVLGLIGPNGSGKSTLLKTLSTELAPISGSFTVAGTSLRGIKPARVAQTIAVVPQEESHAFRFTVWQIVAMGRLARSQSYFETPADEKAIREALEITDCASLADRSVVEVSGGERQRVLIARALAQEAPVLVLDEPTAHLDVAHVAAFVGTIRQLASQGKAIVLAIHDLNVALEVSDDLILLHHGEPRFQGPSSDLSQGPEVESVYGVRFERIERGGRVSLLPQYA
jgi:iron complex transport system ATP-binding protein